MNIKDIDLNLLIVFDFVMRERNITLAARRLRTELAGTEQRAFAFAANAGRSAVCENRPWNGADALR